MSQVIKLFVSQKGQKQRVEQDFLEFDLNGIKKDKFYNKNTNRSVLLVSTISYDMANSEDIALDFGQLGENLLVDFDPYLLEIGTKLSINDVVLQISQECTACNSFSSIHSKLPNLLKNHRGIFAKVIKSGMIKSQDRVSVL